MLPGSRSPNVKDLVHSSNVEVPGLFIYKLTHDIVEKLEPCRREISPSIAHMYFEREKFQIKGVFCEQKFSTAGNKNIQVAFEGSKFKILVDANISENREELVGNFPFWGFSEQVLVYPILDGIENKSVVNQIKFVKCSERMKFRSEPDVYLKTKANFKNDGKKDSLALIELEARILGQKSRKTIRSTRVFSNRKVSTKLVYI